MSHQVYAPNVHLFAYHLRNTLKSGRGKVESNADLLWRKCDEILTALDIKPPLDIDGYNCQPNQNNRYKPDAEPLGSRVDLYPDGLIKIAGKVTLDSQEININGRIYPQRLDDSYALAFNIRHPESKNGIKNNVSLDILGKFNTDQCLLLPEAINSSLGQTIVITAFLTEKQKQDNDKDLESLASDCIAAFIPTEEKRPELMTVGKLFGSHIFECDRLISKTENSNQSSPYRHILVWLFREEAASDKFVSCYREFIELFYYRNKIITSFKKTREDHKKAYDKYEEIESHIEGINQILDLVQPGKPMSDHHLNDLKIKLKDLPKNALEYSRLLRNLEHENNTIAINAKNYTQTLEAIRRRLSTNLDTSLPTDLNPRNFLEEMRRKVETNLESFIPADLSFLETFSKSDCPYFQERIKADLGYFVHGENLVDKAIASIRGMVEIEQAERDRSLEKTIQAVAVSLGTAGVVATSAPYLIKQDPDQHQINLPFSDTLHPFILVLLISLGAGTLVWLSVSALMNWRRIMIAGKKAIAMIYHK